MKAYNYQILISTFLVLIVVTFSCTSNKEGHDNSEDAVNDKDDVTIDNEQNTNQEESSTLHNIDLSHWKVTLPIGAPTEVEPPAILDYANNEVLKEFMYNDPEDTSLVFMTYPNATTANSSYSRTELREQMEPGSNNTNWTFAHGGKMKGTLSVPFISRDEDDKYHRTIVMQIHGRLTNAQRDLIGEDDNNAPPILKVYWQNGKIRVKSKVLKDLDASDEEILVTSAWGDDEGHTFPEVIGAKKFILEIIASEGRLEVILNEKDSVVFDNVHMEKWGVFENYFKAGNYFQSKEKGSHAMVKYYSLEVEH